MMANDWTRRNGWQALCHLHDTPTHPVAQRITEIIGTAADAMAATPGSALIADTWGLLERLHARTARLALRAPRAPEPLRRRPTMPCSAFKCRDPRCPWEHEGDL